MDVARRHLLLDDAFDAARHGGFDREHERGVDYLVVGCEFPAFLTIKVMDWPGGRYGVACSDTTVANKLVNEIDLTSLGLGDLLKACSRAYSILRSVPSRPLEAFKAQTRSMPAGTEVERIAIQRVGQDIFRLALEDFWGGCCPLTGIEDRALLRASHIVPWASCENDEDRLDVFNGFLLAAHIDAAFDRHLMTFDPAGCFVFSPLLSSRAREVIEGSLIVDRMNLTPRHEHFLADHRLTTMANASYIETGALA